MSTYFKNEYLNYYNKLGNSTSLLSSANIIQGKAGLLITTMDRLKNQLDNSSWIEQYFYELKNNVAPSLKKKIEIYAQNIEDGLVQAVNMAINELYPKVSELKQVDAEYDSVISYINSNPNSSDISIYRNKKSEYEKKLNEITQKIDEIVVKIKQLNSIKDLDIDSVIAGIDTLKSLAGSSVTEQLKIISKVKTSTSTNININTNSSASANIGTKVDTYNVTNNGNNKNTGSDSITSLLKKKNTNGTIKQADTSGYIPTITDFSESETQQIVKIDISNTFSPGCTSTWSTLGTTWTVVNTKIDPATYTATAYSKGIRQDSNTARYGDLCLAFSYVHASNLYNGSTQDNAESAYNWRHASEFKDFLSDDKSEILNTIYYEIMNGRPCVVQVNGNKAGTCRHFVTVVGFKDTVKSPQELTEDDLLVLDSWDCKIERMDTETSRFLTNGKQTGNGYTGYYLRVLKA